MGFTALFVSLALAYLTYQRTPFRWLKSYIVLIATHAVFDLSYTFVMFSDVFSGTVESRGHPLFNIFSALVSLILIYVAPRFVQRLLGIGDTTKTRLLTLIPLILLLAGTIGLKIGRAHV